MTAGRRKTLTADKSPVFPATSVKARAVVYCILFVGRYQAGHVASRDILSLVVVVAAGGMPASEFRAVVLSKSGRRAIRPPTVLMITKRMFFTFRAKQESELDSQ